MHEIAPDVYQFDGFPPNIVNIYMIGDVLIDAGTQQDQRRIFRQLKGRTLSAHALTHAHPDHQGSSHAVCEAFKVPLWVGECDAAVMETGDMTGYIPDNWITTVQSRFWTGPAHPVDRGLCEGDVVAGFEVIDVPGHSPGQIAFWRESDRVLILGDVLNNVNLATLVPGLHEPPGIFTVDPALNRESARKLAPLRPRVVAFGHGAPLRDTERFVDFISTLE